MRPRRWPRGRSFTALVACVAVLVPACAMAAQPKGTPRNVVLSMLTNSGDNRLDVVLRVRTSLPRIRCSATAALRGVSDRLRPLRTGTTAGARWHWHLGDGAPRARLVTRVRCAFPDGVIQRTRLVRPVGPGPNPRRPFRHVVAPGTLRTEAWTPPDRGGGSGSGAELYPRGQCTWYVAVRRPDLPYFPGASGDAKNWIDSARSNGFPTGTTPRVGAVAVFRPGQYGAGIYGHVAYVTAVTGDTMTVAEANYRGHPVGSMRTLPSVGVRFIYALDDAPAPADGPPPPPPPPAVDEPSLSVSTTAAGATGVTYTLRFTTSSSGALAAGNGRITLTAPNGTAFMYLGNVQGVAGALISDVYDMTASRDLGYSRGGMLFDGGATGTWTVESDVPAAHTIVLTIVGVTNPPAGTYQLGIVTSADTTVADTPAYTITAPGSLQSPSVSVSPPTAGATNATYTVSLTTSPTGGLEPSGGQITMSAATGTVFPYSPNTQGVAGAVINDVYDVTAGRDLGWSRGGMLFNGGATVTWPVEPRFAPGHVLTLTILGVTNPPIGSYELGLVTSSDRVAVQAPYTIVAP